MQWSTAEAQSFCWNDCITGISNICLIFFTTMHREGRFLNLLQDIQNREAGVPQHKPMSPEEQLHTFFMDLPQNKEFRDGGDIYCPSICRDV